MAENNFKIKFQDDEYNLTDFLKNHPGGFNYIQDYRNKNVPPQLLEKYHSSKAVFYLLLEYKEGQKNGRQESKHKEVEDLEYLVDWSKPMLAQVGKLGDKYKEWLESPVDRDIRLFKNPLLESVTRTPWYMVPLIWLPVVSYFVHKGALQSVETSNGNNLSIFWNLPAFILMGLGIWSIAEYLLHRWFFHFDPKTSRALITFHFLIHGLHHKVPFDSDRLVFPPLPAAIIAVMFYKAFELILPNYTVDLAFGGFGLGYVMYDMTHFYLHHGSPKGDSFLYNMKRYHNQHHFVHQNDAFGVTSPYWDALFGTFICLKKLTKYIDWRVPRAKDTERNNNKEKTIIY